MYSEAISVCDLTNYRSGVSMSLQNQGVILTLVWLLGYWNCRLTWRYSTNKHKCDMSCPFIIACSNHFWSTWVGETVNVVTDSRCNNTSICNRGRDITACCINVPFGMQILVTWNTGLVTWLLMVLKFLNSRTLSNTLNSNWSIMVCSGAPWLVANFCCNYQPATPEG